MTLHIESLGSGGNLVLLHGWGMHGGIWQDVPSRLASRYRVHVVDLPGLGHSPSCEPYTLDHMVQILSAALPQPVHVCGWSLGGEVAMQWALAQPQQVQKLILVGATPKFVSEGNWNYGMPEDVFSQFAHEVEQDYRGTLMRFLSLQAHGGETSREQIKQLRERFFERGKPAPEVLQAGLRILLGTDLRDQICHLQQPTLLIHGARDTLVPAAAALWMQTQLQDAQLFMLDAAAHAPFLSHPTDFTKMILDFLEHP